MVWKAASWKATLLRAALGGAMLLGGALLPGGTAQAQDRHQCFERLRREEWRLERDIERHGFHSRQAQRDRRRIHELRDRCRFERRHDRRWDGNRDRGDRGRHRGWDRDRDGDDRGRHWRHRDRDRDRNER